MAYFHDEHGQHRVLDGIDDTVVADADAKTVLRPGQLLDAWRAGLLGKGAGNVLLRLSAKTGKDIRGAAQAILDDRNVLQGLFGSEQP